MLLFKTARPIKLKMYLTLLFQPETQNKVRTTMIEVNANFWHKLPFIAGAKETLVQFILH
jgi:hypothetical protein